MLAGRAALRAIASDFQARNDDVEVAIALNLPLQAVEEVALEFRDLAATQASHMNVVALGPPLIKMLFALHVHEIKLIYQAMPLEQL